MVRARSALSASRTSPVIDGMARTYQARNAAAPTTTGTTACQYRRATCRTRCHGDPSAK